MEPESPLPSNRSFGGVFVVSFLVLTALSVWNGGRAWPWFVGASGTVLLTTLVRPALLTPFNRWWMRLATLLHRVSSPLLLGVIFYGMFTPMALVMRLAGRDVLKRKFDRSTASYWVRRDPPGPDRASFRDQF